MAENNNSNEDWAQAQLNKVSQEAAEEKPGTHQLLLEVLNRMNCPYEKLGDDDIQFQYQGGHFIASANDEYNYIRIRYLYFYSVEMYDKERVEKLKRVVNKANTNFLVQTFYHVDKDDNTMCVHCQSTFYFTRRIDDLEGYLDCELRGFFNQGHYVHMEMEREDNDEEE